MPKFKPILLCLAVLYLCNTESQAQNLLKRLKQKAADVAEKVVDKKTDEVINGKGSGQGAATGDQGGSGTTTAASAGSRGRPVNKGGAGLITTPPDVNENLSGAERAYNAKSYGEARYSLQQAILGVELQLGQKLLKSLPETVASLPAQTDKDQVASGGWGWAGLTIHREYQKDDKQLTFTVANNSVLLSAVNMFLANGSYGQTTGGQQNWKQTKVKGNKAVIEYDESSGYKLSVPLGQSSLVLFEGVNFANEPEMMAAANQFDIDAIKRTLGEK